jgi:hypothetical protein
VDGPVEAPGALLKGKRGHDLACELRLVADGEAAVEAGVVDAVAMAVQLRHQRPDALAQLVEHPCDLAGRHPGLEVVQQRVVGALETLEVVEALCEAALQIHYALQVRQERREVRGLPGIHPGVLGERASPRDLGAELGGHPARLLPLAAGHANEACVVGFEVPPLDLGGRLLDQPTQLVRDEALVLDASQCRNLLGAVLGAGRRHLGSLVPFQERSRAGEVAELTQCRSQPIETALHAPTLSGRAPGGASGVGRSTGSRLLGLGRVARVDGRPIVGGGTVGRSVA